MNLSSVTRRTLLALCVAALTGPALLAAGKPDFSGAWKLNKEKSVYGAMPVPDNFAMTIAHKDPDLALTITLNNPMGAQKSESKLKTDGSENTHTTGRVKLTSRIEWDGAVMVMKTKRVMEMSTQLGQPPQPVEINGEERWQLSADGKTLTIDVKMAGPQGEFTVKRVLDKAGKAE